MEHRTARWREVAIRSIASRRPIAWQKSTRWIPYTDADTDLPEFGDLLSAETTPDPHIRGGRMGRMCVAGGWGGVAEISPPRRGLFRRSGAVLCLELLAVLGAPEQIPPQMAARFVCVYVDGDTALDPGPCWDSDADIVDGLVSKHCDALQRHSICAWIIRVRPARIPSVLPDHGRRVPFSALYRVGFAASAPLF